MPEKSYRDEDLRYKSVSERKRSSLGANESLNETADRNFYEMTMAGLKGARWYYERGKPRHSRDRLNGDLDLQVQSAFVRESSSGRDHHLQHRWNE